MRVSLFRSSCLLALLIAPPASAAVTMAWTPIGNLGNACQLSGDAGGGQGCYGAVSYTYSIGTYDVTNAQYAEFLNAKAASDPLGLYNTKMSIAGGESFGGIRRSGSSGSYTYAPIAGRENMPVNWVNFFDALRFANWLNNGQGNGSTETGAYTLLGGTPTPSNGATVTRNAGATIFLPSEDEWYKAAYYNAASTSYFAYPAGSNTQTTCATPTATANQANCNRVVDNLTIKGSYTGSASPYGTFDQGGNVWQWNEAIVTGSFRSIRGGSFIFGPGALATSIRSSDDPTIEELSIGFRVAPEPSFRLGLAASLVTLLGLAGWRRSRA